MNYGGYVCLDSLSSWKLFHGKKNSYNLNVTEVISCYKITTLAVYQIFSWIKNLDNLSLCVKEVVMPKEVFFPSSGNLKNIVLDDNNNNIF